MMTFASARERNHSRFRHSSRNLPLKLSATPFCQGLPGSINAVPMPCDPGQQGLGYELWPVVAAQECRRAACTHEARQHIDHAWRAHAAIDLKPQPLLGALA